MPPDLQPQDSTIRRTGEGKLSEGNGAVKKWVRSPRAQPRDASGRRAPLQRAPGPVDHPATRQHGQGRDRTRHRPQPANHFDHCQCADPRWPVATRGAFARPRRPTARALFAQSGRRISPSASRLAAAAPNWCSSISSARSASGPTNPMTLPSRPFILSFLERGIEIAVNALLSPAERQRLVGVGIAAPFEMWNWQQETGAPPETVNALARNRHQGRSRSARRRCRSTITTMPLQPALRSSCSAIPDTAWISCTCSSAPSSAEAWCSTAACFPAERAMPARSVLCPSRCLDGGKLRYDQMLRHVSILSLAERITASGGDPHGPVAEPRGLEPFRRAARRLDRRRRQGAGHVTVISATSVIDFESIIIDGGFPAAVRDDIVSRTILAMQDFDQTRSCAHRDCRRHHRPVGPGHRWRLPAAAGQFRPGSGGSVQGDAIARVMAANRLKRGATP